MLRNLRLCFRILAIFLSLSAATAIAAEGDIERVQRDVVSAWIVSVQGDARTRTLNINGAQKRQDGRMVLDATYGWSDGAQSAVKAELTVMPDSYRLELTTQTNSIIVAEGSGTGIFVGTFKLNSGAAMQVKLEKISAEALTKRRADLVAAKAPCNAKATLDAGTESRVSNSTVDRPRLSVGDCWVYRTTDLWRNEVTETYEYRITALNEDNVTLERKTISSTNTRTVGTRITINAKTSNSPTAFRVVNGKNVPFEFPLQIGKGWENEFDYVFDRIQYKGWSTAKVEEWEDIVTPVGKVRALRVTHSGGYSYGAGCSGRQIDRFWYVPEIKWWVQYENYLYSSNCAAGKGALSTQVRRELIGMGVKQ